jgi:hypothetical protein
MAGTVAAGLLSCIPVAGFSPGRQACRYAGGAGDQVRVRHQHADPARSLGIEVPSGLLAAADDVIE